jgi:hypothetical protein
MTWVAVAVGVGSAVVGGVAQNRAAKKGARAAQEGNAASNKLQWDMYQQNRQDMLPAMQDGNAARAQFMQMMGMTPSAAPASFAPGSSPQDLVVEGQDGMPMPNPQLYASNPQYRQAWDATAAQHRAQWKGKGYWEGSDNDWIRSGINSRFQMPAPAQPAAPGAAAGTPGGTAAPARSISDMLKATPGYQFRLDEGRKTVEAGAAAAGGLNSGKTLKALTQYGQNYATGIYGDHMNRLANLANIGQTATTQTGQWGQNYAQNAGNNMMKSGAARASMYGQQGQNYAGMAGAIGSGVGQAYDYNSAMNGGGSGWYVGKRPGVG